jgi:hypothetical protein
MHQQEHELQRTTAERTVLSERLAASEARVQMQERSLEEMTKSVIEWHAE